MMNSIADELIYYVQSNTIKMKRIDPDLLRQLYLNVDVFAEAEAEIGHLELFQIVKTICLTPDQSQISILFAQTSNYKGLVIAHNSGLPIHNNILYTLLQCPRSAQNDQCLDYVWNTLRYRQGFPTCNTIEDVKSLHDWYNNGGTLHRWMRYKNLLFTMAKLAPVLAQKSEAHF